MNGRESQNYLLRGLSHATWSNSMNSNSFTDINDFASNVAVPPQLRALVAQEVARQVAPILEENQALKDRVDRQDETIADQAGEIADLKDQLGEITHLKAQVDTLEGDLQRLRGMEFGHEGRRRLRSCLRSHREGRAPTVK